MRVVILDLFLGYHHLKVDPPSDLTDAHNDQRHEQRQRESCGTGQLATNPDESPRWQRKSAALSIAVSYAQCNHEDRLFNSVRVRLFVKIVAKAIEKFGEQIARQGSDGDVR